jgi:hypothetical protein
MESAARVENYKVETWDLKRSRAYGSEHHNVKTLKVEKVEVSADGKSVFLILPDITPTWVMQISYQLRGKDGAMVPGLIQNTIYQLGE